MLRDSDSFWTDEQVKNLNDFQRSSYMHPFTCGGAINCREDLVAKPDGWHCPKCGYTQDWAHGFMLDGSWKINALELFS